MKGRKPKPAEVRRAEGNPGKRPLPEPVVMGGVPPKAAMEPPENLADAAKEWWREAVPILHRVGLLDVVDRAALEMAATAYARFRSAGETIAEQGELSTGSQGQTVEHPAMNSERAAMTQFLRFAEQYALTPVARTRLGLAELQRRSMLDEVSDSVGEVKLEAVT